MTPGSDHGGICSGTRSAHQHAEGSQISLMISGTLTLKRGWPGAPETVEAVLCVPCSLLGPLADESPSSSDESSSSPPAPWKAALAAAWGSAGGREGLDREGLDRDWLEKPREGRARSAWDA